MILDAIVRSYAYTKCRASNIVGRPHKQLSAFATDTRELCPGERGRFPKPITLEGQLSRATASFEKELAGAISDATNLDCNHRPTLVHTIHDVTVANGYLYKGWSAYQLSKLGWPGLRHPENVEEMVLVSTPSGAVFFGNWVFDGLLELIANDLGKQLLKIRPNTNYTHTSGIIDILNLSDDFNEKPLHIRHLHVIEDIGYNTYKSDRLKKFRERIRAAEIDSNSSPIPIYIMRGRYSAPGRTLENESEIIKFLRGKGFGIVDPITLSVEEIFSIIADCPIVIGVEGSQLSYGFLGLAEGGLMLTLQPPYRFQASYRPRCVAAGLDWGYLVGIETRGGFNIPISELNEIIKPYV